MEAKNTRPGKFFLEKPLRWPSRDAAADEEGPRAVPARAGGDMWGELQQYGGTRYIFPIS